MVAIDNVQVQARYWRDLANIEMAREDAAEMALRHLTGITNPAQDVPPARYYAQAYASS
jgi:hypothetical protein